MRRPSNSDLPPNMDGPTLSERGQGASDRNYTNAHRYLGTLEMRIRELTEDDNKNPEQLEKLQQKVLDIKDVFSLIERDLEHVEDDDWQPRLKLPPRLIEPEAPARTSSAPPEDLRPKDSRRSPANDIVGTTSSTASRYRPSEDYRPSPPPEPINRTRSPQPPVPQAPSPPPAVGFAAVPDLRSGVTQSTGNQAPLPQRGSRDTRGPDPASSNAPLPPLPYNVKFDHGPLFSDCVASLKLSHYVYELVDAKADLKDAREKLRKAEEAEDTDKVQKYRKKTFNYDLEVKELEQDHWKMEVNPLRQAYSVEILRCLQQLNAAIKYTEELTDNGKLEADALSDMALLKEWLNRCLNQPKTWRKDDRLLVGLTEGHPRRKLKDASYVTDLLEEAAPPAVKKSDDRDKPSTKSSRKRDDESDSDRRSKADESGSAMKPIAINADLLEGLLNGAVPKEVAANITQCPECNGTGGEIEHAKICSECDGQGRKKDSEDIIELCPKCNGRGFALSRKYRCPVCDAYKIVMNVPAETLDPRKSRDRDESSSREPDPAPKRSDSTRKKPSFAPDVATDAPPQRSRSKKGRDRDYSPERERSEPDDFSDSRKSKSSRSKKNRDRDDRDRDYSDSRSPSPDNKRSRSRSRRQSTSRPKDEQPEPAAGLTGLIGAIAGAAQEPGSWRGNKGKKILEAALAAGAGGVLGGGGGGKEESDDARSEGEDDDRHGKHHRKRRGSRYDR
jgi:hypothetical protein